MDYLSAHPRQIFLIDAIGALISAFSLGVLLTRFVDFFGMPVQTLAYLAIAAIGFGLFSTFSYLSFPAYWPSLMRTIGSINLAYCAVTLALVIYHSTTLTVWGHTYFILELLIVVPLALIELKTAKNVAKPAN